MTEALTGWVDNPSSSWYQRQYAKAVASAPMHRGIRIARAIFRPSIEARARDKVCAALDVLADACPQQMERLPRFAHTISVMRLAGALGMWRTDLRAILLDQDFVLAEDTTPEYVGSVIVHELTHARLDRAGIQAVPHHRTRCERICVLAERNYLARLPESRERTRLFEINSRYLQAPPSFWSEAARAERIRLWRRQQPWWRRTLYDVRVYLSNAHRAALANNRWS